MAHPEQPTKLPIQKQPWPFPFNIIQEEWPEVKKAKWSFVLCALVFLIIGGMSISYLFNSFVVPGKEATIQALNTRLLIQSGTNPDHPFVIWQGPTNSITLTNQFQYYLCQSSVDCAITNVINPSSTALASASLTVYNTSSNIITFFMTDPAVRPIGGAELGGMKVAPGKIGVISIACFGQQISEYANASQQ